MSTFNNPDKVSHYAVVRDGRSCQCREHGRMQTSGYPRPSHSHIHRDITPPPAVHPRYLAFIDYLDGQPGPKSPNRAPCVGIIVFTGCCVSHGVGVEDYR